MYDIKMMIRMGLDKEVIIGLYKVFKVLNQDDSFTLRKYVKMMSTMIQGEKLVKHELEYITSTFMPPFPSKAFMTNIMAVDDMKQVFRKQIGADRTAPISIYLCVTDKCPNNCVYCSSKHRKHEEELTTEAWIRTINELQDMNTSIIGITGGEPMIRKDIYKLVEAIDDRSKSILFTSGINLSLKKAQLLKEKGLFGLGISLDSADQEKHNVNRNSDQAFDYALRALRIARKANLYTIAQTVIIKEEVNEENLFRLFRLAKKNGAHEVKILEPILSGNLLIDVKDNHKNAGLLYDEETRNQLVVIQHKANKLKGMPKISTFAYTESKGKFGCGAGTQHSYISASGDMYPCDFVSMNFGNVQEESVSVLWHNMNKTIGQPKTRCFAQQVNRQIYQESQGDLPLDLQRSCQICKANRSTVMPDYYRNLQN